MTEFFQQVLNATALGCIYCLIASGLTLVYGIMHVPNFAQGNIYMMGAYLTFLFVSLFGTGYYPLAFLLTVLVMGAFGVLVDKFCFRPVHDAPHINSFVVSIALLMIIEGLVILCFGADYKEVKIPWSGILDFRGISISFQRLLLILGTILVMLGLQYFLKRTKAGMCMEAMSQNSDLALMVGINVNQMTLLSFMISTGLAGVAGVLIAPVSFVYPAMGMPPLLVAFAAVIFGGLGSLPGAVIGSFIMAYVEVFSTQYISATASDIAIFGIMIAILIFRPKGIMGGRE